MRALITRPEEDAEETAELLRQRGIEPVIEPLMTIVRIGRARTDLAGIQALVFTSANGARAFGAVEPARTLPVFAVGDATARTARELGFRSVASAKGDVEDLARVVSKTLDPKAGAILHAAGSKVAGDLAGILGRQGFEVRRAVLYEAKAVDKLSTELVRQFRDKAISMVLFFSPRTAAVFVNLAGKADLSEALGRVAAFCLSKAVADSARGFPWRETAIAARPELPAMMDEIDKWLRRIQTQQS